MSNREYLKRQSELQRQYEHEKPNGCLTLLSAAMLFGVVYLCYLIVFKGF